MSQGILYYAGIAAENRFTLTRQAGVTPGIITANFLMGATIPQFGPVELSFGGFNITMPNCRLKRRSVQTSAKGKLQQCTLEDRRWLWQFNSGNGPLYGYFNHYEKGVKITTARAAGNIRSCQELAAFVLTWMGETRFDVSVLPNDFYPVVMWDGEDPAAALESLVDTVGCQVVLQWDNSIRIVLRGTGQPAPSDTRVMDYTISQEPSVIPQFLIVESGMTRFQADLPLEAIGYEPDTKEIKPIDNLSYRPAGGWGKEAPGYFYGVTDPTLRDLAQNCVWRMFRPKVPVTLLFSSLQWRAGTLAPRISELWRILPLESQQLDLWRNPQNDKLRDAQIIGMFCDQHHGWKNNVTLQFLQNIDVNFFRNINLENDRQAGKDWTFRGHGRGGEMPFAIDSEEGIIRTYEPLYALELDGNNNAVGILPPQVCLRTSFPVRDPDSRAPYRQQFVFNVPGGVTGVVKTIRVDEIFFECSYPSVEIASPIGPNDFAQICYFYATRYLNQFYDGPSAVIPMKGFAFDIEVDGAVRSVTFSRDEAGRATTTVEWHTERPEMRPTYAELFDKRTVNQVVQSFRNMRGGAAQRNGKRDRPGFRHGGGGFGV